MLSFWTVIRDHFLTDDEIWFQISAYKLPAKFGIYHIIMYFLINDHVLTFHNTTQISFNKYTKSLKSIIYSYTFKVLVRNMVKTNKKIFNFLFQLIH